jgi:hypothetical protein
MLLAAIFARFQIWRPAPFPVSFCSLFPFVLRQARRHVKTTCVTVAGAMLAVAMCAVGAEKSSYSIAGDTMEFPGRFALPDQQEQQRLAQWWMAPPSPNRPLPPDRLLLGRSFPFRDGVEFGRRRVSKSAPLLVRENGVYAEVAWDNIGFFLKGIENAEQFKVLLALLHDEWSSCLNVGQLRQVLAAVDSQTEGFPLRVTRRDFDADLISKSCFVKDGVWCVDFVIIEGASVVEYKYAVDKHNRIARLRRLLVEGPPSHGPGHYPGPIRVHPGVLQASKTAEPQKEPEVVAEGTAEPYIDWYGYCSQVLRTAAFLPEWRTDLADRDATVRRKAASELRHVTEVANDSKHFQFHFLKDAIPDLAKALRDEDEEVRHYSASALGNIGALAVGELRKALADPNTNARISAARAIATVGPAAKDAIPDLRKALADPEPAVREAAEKAIKHIEQGAPTATLERELRALERDRCPLQAYIQPPRGTSREDVEKVYGKEPRLEKGGKGPDHHVYSLGRSNLELRVLYRNDRVESTEAVEHLEKGLTRVGNLAYAPEVKNVISQYRREMPMYRAVIEEYEDGLRVAPWNLR